MATQKGRAVFVALTLFIIYFLFIASPTAQSEKEYRRRTEDGLSRRHSKLQGDISDEEWTRKTNEKLQAILDAHPHGSRGRTNGDGRSAYDSVRVDEQQEEEDSAIAGSGSSYGGGAAAPAGGDKKSSHPSAPQRGHPEHGKARYPKGGIANDDDDEDAVEDIARERTGGGKSATVGGSKNKQANDPGKDMAREQLQTYLKKPVVIFSKTYCPHSRRAKQLLTEIYTITPAPLIIELDQLNDMVPLPSPATENDSNGNKDHQPPSGPARTTMGRRIQDLLGEISGRNTVPNIMVGMQSIGGNDLIWELHEKGQLIAEFNRLVGKRVSIEINEEFAKDAASHNDKTPYGREGRRREQ